MKKIAFVLNSFTSLIVILASIPFIYSIFDLLNIKISWLGIYPAEGAYKGLLFMLFVIPYFLLLILNIISWKRYKKEKYNFGIVFSIIIAIFFIYFLAIKIRGSYRYGANKNRMNDYNNAVIQLQLQDCNENQCSTKFIEDKNKLDYEYGIYKK